MGPLTNGNTWENTMCSLSNGNTWENTMSSLTDGNIWGKHNALSNK